VLSSVEDQALALGQENPAGPMSSSCFDIDAKIDVARSAEVDKSLILVVVVAIQL